MLDTMKGWGHVRVRASSDAADSAQDQASHHMLLSPDSFIPPILGNIMHRCMQLSGPGFSSCPPFSWLLHSPNIGNIMNRCMQLSGPGFPSCPPFPSLLHTPNTGQHHEHTHAAVHNEAIWGSRPSTCRQRGEKYRIKQ